MKNNIYKVIILIITFMVVTSTAAQNKDLRMIAGKVTDAQNNPIAGALVLAQEGEAKIYTSPSGEFSIMSNLKEIIRIEATGYESRFVYPSDIKDSKNLVLKKDIYKMGENDLVNISFGKQYKRNSVGNIAYLNAEDIQRQETGNTNSVSAINGRIPGMFGFLNAQGFGNATIMVDGVTRSYTDVNVQEVDQISVLKDPTSKMLYGSSADKAIIMITTKRGTPYHRKMNVFVESSLGKPKSLPKYLNSADYMGLYNESLTNNGLPALYSQSSIDKTRSGISPLVDKEAFANEEYYNSRYLNDFTNSQKINLDASGGNNIAQYYANVGYETGSKLLNMGEEKGARDNKFKIRGNASYKVNDFIKAKLDVFTVLNFKRGANADFWTNASTLRPNYYPQLIPDSLLPLSMRNSAIRVNGNYVPGGTSKYTTNIYSELNSKGYSSTSEYVIQMSTGLDFDFGFITKGLTGNVLFGFDSWSTGRQFQKNSYAVYEPIWVAGKTVADSLTFKKTNTDNLTGDLDTDSEDVYRHFVFTGTLDYKREFNNVHKIAATSNFFYDRKLIPGAFFEDKALTIGQRVNYSYKDKYLAEFAGALVGSGKFPVKNRFKYAPSVGLGWIISDEDFLKDNSALNFLKLRASAGIIYTDESISSYNIYKTLFASNGNFNYNDGINSNTRWSLTKSANLDLVWLKRTEIQVGFEALLFKSLSVEGGYFYRKSEGEITQLTNATPSYLGSIIPEQNYNNYNNQGFELGLNYSKKWNDFSFALGYNMLYSIPKVLRVDEPNYTDKYRLKTGKATDAIFGLVADGLYQATDFSTIDYTTQTFVLNPGIVGSAFGAVQPGDVKYVDQNADNIINDNDNTPIGFSSSRFQHGLNIELQYKNFELFALGIASLGQSVYYTNDYYQVYGELKYSNQVLDRYHYTNNPTGTYPRLSSTASSSSHNFKNSTFWLYKNDSFNLQSVQLAYSLSQKIVEKLKMEKFRIYLKANDVLLVSKIKEKKELNTGAGSPLMRYVTLGVNATF